MKVPGLDMMRVQLITAYVGENIAGGYYHQLSLQYADHPALSRRLRKTAGDEVRHGGYFSRCHEENYGRALGLRDPLMTVGRAVARLDRLVPRAVLPLQARFNLIARGEAAAVMLLEKDLRESAPNAYLAVVQRILPDEHAHAKPYRLQVPAS